MNKKRSKKEITGVFIIFLIVVTIILITSLQRIYRWPTATKALRLVRPAQRVLRDTLVTTPVSDTLQRYTGNFFSVIFPRRTWHISISFDCGQDDTEKVAMYYSDPTTYANNVPGSIINVCVQSLDENQVLSYMVLQKQMLDRKVTEHSIDFVTWQQFHNLPALVYEATRIDYPGHYEKTILFLRGKNKYRITWSIQAASLDQMQYIIKHTSTDYNLITSSFMIR